MSAGSTIVSAFDDLEALCDWHDALATLREVWGQGALE
jgi:hypothetical protein